MNCQATCKKKAPNTSAPTETLGGHVLLSLTLLVPPKITSTHSRLKHPPAPLLGFSSSPPPAALQQHPGTFHARQKRSLGIFSKQEPKDWSRAAVCGCKQYAMLQMNRMKAVWSLFGAEIKIKRKMDLASQHMGAPARGYAAGREELGLRRWKDLLNGIMEEFHL